jgi:branched-chain amino acid transport system substrate-binding protein
VKTVAFLGFSDAFGDLMYNSLVSEAKAAGINVVANERYGRADTSVTAQALKVVSTRPDAVMLGGTGTPGAMPVLALKERGYKGKVYGNHGMISADFLRLAGKAADGIICPTGPVTAAEQLPASNPIRKVALDYLAAYKKANGTEPTDSFAAYGFDGWLAFADAAKRALATGAKPGTADFRKALRDALFSTKELVGTQGVYNFHPDNSSWVDGRAVILVQIEDGKYKLVP